jgi:pimeloyl-ACP methyl ester carboxylesterase
MSQIALYEWVHDANYNGAMRLSGDIPLKGAFVGTPFETLIVDGRWDMTYPPDKGMLLAKEIEGGRHMLLEDSSHHAFSEEPERFFRLLEDFLSELPLPDPQRSRAWTQRVSPWVEKIMGRENA